MNRMNKKDNTKNPIVKKYGIGEFAPKKYPNTQRVKKNADQIVNRQDECWYYCVPCIETQ